MKSEEVRKRFLDFFNNRGHAVIPSASLVPENDPTTLFTGSGMQSLLPYLLGETHPEGTRLVNSQKCFRAEDIEEVGDNRHTTFFEMLGNWSLGDYFKKEQLRWFFEFLTNEAGLDPSRIYVTAFIGDEKAGIPKDTETAEIWKTLFAEKGINARETDIGEEEDGYTKGMQGARIFFYGKKNWWNRGRPSPETTPVGDPAGPDSEVFYDFGTEHNKKWGEHCHPNCDCGRFVEIGNSVFMQYVKQADGSFKELPNKNVDFGGGLERITAAANDNPDIFQIDVLKNAIEIIENASYGFSYESSLPHMRRPARRLLDHLRAALFLISDGVNPGSKERGSVVRKLLKKATLSANWLAFREDPFEKLINNFTQMYENIYPSLKGKKEVLLRLIKAEHKRTVEALKAGVEKMRKMKNITPKDVFDLHQSAGLDTEYSQILLDRLGIEIDWDEVEKYKKEHSKESRAGAEKKFKGGLADTSEVSVKYHTATHLLHQALRAVLGEHVFQKGSNITPERLRFDFSHPQKMTPEEVRSVEDLVNEKIQEALPVSYEDVPLEEAEKRGAVGLFGEKYGDTVRVYQIGEGDKKFSLEFCGGPHVKNTSELGHFKILKEEAVAARVRRVKAVLE